MQSKTKRRRFTMVECIIVVIVLAVVAVLVVLTVGLMADAKERRLRINCAGNLKQVGLALQMYAGDFDHWFPLEPTASETYRGFEVLLEQNYISSGKVWWCPSTEPVWSKAYEATRWDGTKYMTSRRISPSTYRYIGQGLRDDSPAPRTTSLVYDQFGNHPKNSWVNVLFIDGHVEGAKPGTKPWAQND